MYLTQRIIRHNVGGNEQIWINILSGAVDQLDTQTLAKVQDLANGGGSTDKELRERLINRGYLYASRKNEREAFSNLVRKA